jgi:YD repeat-containing protein
MNNAHRMLLATLASFSNNALATVDMERLTYYQEWTMLNNYWGQLVETYYGSSSQDGIFGRSWCPGIHLPRAGEPESFKHVSLDQIVNVQDGKLWLTQCGMQDRNGFMELYEPDEATLASIGDRPLEQALKDAAGTGQRLLFRNTFPKRHAQVLAWQSGKWRWEDGDHDAPVVVFNDQGVMEKVDNIDMQRDDQGRLMALRQRDTAVVTFRYGDAGRVVEFNTPEGYGGDIYYNEKGWQTSHQNGWNRTYRFNYNNVGSLTGAIWPDGTRITIFYDPKTARITSFIDRLGAMENYTVVQGAPDQRKVMLKRTLNGKKEYDMTFSYQYNALGLPVSEKVRKRDENGEWIDSENSLMEK